MFDVKKTLLNFPWKIFFKNSIFILFTSLIIYFILHLQFLLGMPQAALSLLDILVMLILSTTAFIFANGNKKQYFIMLAIVLWPLVQLQYFFIAIFNKPFLLSELSNFTTLIKVSIPLMKVVYIGLFLLWSAGVIYALIFGIKNWRKHHIILKIIPMILIFWLIKILTFQSDIPHWMGSYRTAFFMTGIVKTIQFQEKKIHSNQLTQQEIIESFNYLKELENERLIYSVKNSPEIPPKTKRPIIIILWESFYDFKDFLDYFDTDPFPQEYRQIMKEAIYTGPNASYGSFDARFTTLTGSLNIRPTRKNSTYEPLSYYLMQSGYSNISLEAVGPTYGLEHFYDFWFFKNQQYELFTGGWNGSGDIDSYLDSFQTCINNYHSDAPPFFFGFTFLGHVGTMRFTEKLPDLKGINRFIENISDDKKDLAEKLIKSGVFNAERLLHARDIILEKYPDALIVFKTDHYSSEHNEIFHDSSFSEELKTEFFNSPQILPLIVFDGEKGIKKLPEEFAPENIPLMILAEAGLPYRNTTISLLYRDNPKGIISTYGKLYKKEHNNYRPLLDTDPEFEELTKRKKAIENISVDLYQGNAYTIKLLKKESQ